jgi:hypothetical protein
MRIRWDVTDDDISRVQIFFAGQAERAFVRRRIHKNVVGPPPSVTRADMWRIAVGCLLTTQQRSGPGSPVSRLITTEPNPLSLAACSTKKDLAGFVEKTLTKAGGIRMAKTIGESLAENLAWLDGDGGWTQLEAAAADLAVCRGRDPRGSDVEVERRAALLVQTRLKGFGPKQSRNLWQGLGLARYEIPADSRISKWLRASGFPFEVSASALGDLPVYLLVMDGFQSLCREAGILPCVLDAAIFASFDTEEWPEDELFW